MDNARHMYIQNKGKYTERNAYSTFIEDIKSFQINQFKTQTSIQELQKNLDHPQPCLIQVEFAPSISSSLSLDLSRVPVHNVLTSQ